MRFAHWNLFVKFPGPYPSSFLASDLSLVCLIPVTLVLNENVKQHALGLARGT